MSVSPSTDASTAPVTENGFIHLFPFEPLKPKPPPPHFTMFDPKAYAGLGSTGVVRPGVGKYKTCPPAQPDAAGDTKEEEAPEGRVTPYEVYRKATD